MISSKEEYYKYLEADSMANGLKTNSKNIIWKFIKSLRRLEYAKNCYVGIKAKIWVPIYKYIWRYYSIQTGLSIYPNSFAEGLTIYHYGCIIVNGSVKAGKNVTLQGGVNIAEDVMIGDNCYLAPGVKIAKNVSIPENCVIGYNAVVLKSLPEANSTYVGIPARLLNHNGYVVNGKEESFKVIDFYGGGGLNLKERAHIYYTMGISAISVFLNCFINLYLTPKITNSVGADAYGFVSLAKNFVSYANIVMTALNSYAARYMTVAYIQKDEKRFKQYYNTVFWGIFFIGGSIFVVGIVATIFLEKILNIPSHLISDVKIMFAFTFLTFYITTISTVFLAVGYVKDRLDLVNSIKGVSYIVEIAILIFTFIIFMPRVWYVGLALLAAAVVVFIGTVNLTNKLLPGNSLKISYFNKKALKTLVVNGIWNSANSMGNALNSGLDLLVSNLFLDALSMGQVSIAKTINNMIYTVYATISQPFQPTFLKYFSAKDNEALLKELKYSMRVCGFVTNLIFAGFIILGKDFYSLWIPTQNIELVYRLTAIAMLPCITEGCMYPIYYIYTLTIKNKIPCFITIVGGLLNVGAMVVLLKYTQLGVYAIVITTAVIMNIINLIANPIYMSKCLKVKIRTFYPEIFINIVACLCALLLMRFVVLVLPKQISWLLFLLKGGVCVIVGSLGQLVVLFRPSELKRIVDKMIKRFGRIKA